MYHITSKKLCKSRKLKVLIITKWYPTKNNPISGIFVKELANAIALYDEVIILHAYQDYSIKKLYEIVQYFHNDIKIFQIKYKKILSSQISYIFGIILLMYILNNLVKKIKPDVIHAHVTMIGILAIILKKMYGIPFVVTEHYKIIENENGFIKKILNKIKLLVSSFVLENADLLIFPSKAMVEDLRQQGINIKSFEIIPNVVNTRIFYPVKNLRENYIKKILFVGGLNPIKGIPYLLHALKQIKEKRKDFTLEIVGDGPKRFEYEKLARELHIEDVVKFLGAKSKREVAKIMQKCDFFVLPSLWENNPCVLIEAMACGKPVISTSHGGPKEIVKSSCGLIISPENINELAKAIEYMLDHYNQYSPNKISLYARENFSHIKIGEELHKIYCKLVYKTE